MIAPTGLFAEPDAVVLDLDAPDGEQAVQALHERLAGATNAVMDGPKFLADVVVRMRIAPDEGTVRAFLEGSVLAQR